MNFVTSQEIFGCDVSRVLYDLDNETGHVYMPEGNCTDMSKTIKYFVKQIPQITHIITWAGGNVDTQYVIHEGEWISI